MPFKSIFTAFFLFAAPAISIRCGHCAVSAAVVCGDSAVVVELAVVVIVAVAVG